jgi:hypothetical protein
MRLSPMTLKRGWGSDSSPMLMACSPVSPQDTSLVLTRSVPRMLPPQFGYQAWMDDMGRRLFEFCTSVSCPLFDSVSLDEAFTDWSPIDTMNWCPGRSVLRQTNLWLTDLAPMHKDEGIFMLSGVSLASIYMIICRMSVSGSKSISDMSWRINISTHSSTHLKAGKTEKAGRSSLWPYFFQCKTYV